MYYCEGRFSILVELNSKNDIFLFSLLNNSIEEYKKFVSDQHIPSAYTEFKKTLRTWFLNGRMYQFLVYFKHDKENPVGTIFFYGHDEYSQSIKISAFFEKESRNKLLVPESLGLSIIFAKQIIKVKNLQFSVYVENEKMKRLAKKMRLSVVNVNLSVTNSKRNVEIYKISSNLMEEISKKISKLHR